MLRILLLYSEEFKKNNIWYNLQDSRETWEINENIFSAIILKIIENCSKYCKQNTTLTILIEKDIIRFKMTSLKIEFTEKNKIFDNWYSWRNTIKSWKQSSWKGLYHAKEMANFHWIELWVIPPELKIL